MLFTWFPWQRFKQGVLYKNREYPKSTVELFE